ncbi:hypothetical protein, partial [Paraburkholderia elongata]|uniref:hypothetical protein n=1 Tax=Paraburkholderia elongata TaxID=2675747 RepID=UPI001C130833
MVKAQNAHNEIHLRHREQIAQWVRDRKLSLVTPAGIETTILDEGCIRLADVKAYLEQCCIPYREDGPRTASSSRPLGNATGADAFSEEDRRRLLDAEFWGERE